jgi:Ser/Thr protein kinase RdoA (MazF antagonist)
VLFQTEASGGFVYLQSGVPGKPLRNELSPSGGKLLSAQIDVAEDWLEKFQMLAPPAEDSGAAFRQVLAGASVRLPTLLLSTANAALPLLSAVPAVAVHGDFWAKNVLTASGCVSVVDWDAFHYGSPVEDLFTFAVAMAYQWKLDAEQGADVIWNVFLGSSPLTARTRAGALRTLARWNLSQNLLAPLFLISLVSRLGRTELGDNPAWHVFAARYAGAGLPSPLH